MQAQITLWDQPRKCQGSFTYFYQKNKIQMVISYLIYEIAYLISYFLKSKMLSIVRHTIILFTKKKAMLVMMIYQL